jgi:hypothetical protein
MAIVIGAGRMGSGWESEAEPGSSWESEVERRSAGTARAYDWSADVQAPDIGDPASSFDWEIPVSRPRIRKAA